MNFKVGVLLGRLSSGMQGDHGNLYHAVVRKKAKRPPCPYNDFGRKIIENDDFEADVSLCGKNPGPRSIGWEFSDIGAEVTCEKCLSKLGGTEFRANHQSTEDKKHR